MTNPRPKTTATPRPDTTSRPWHALAEMALGRISPAHPFLQDKSLSDLLDRLRQPDAPRDALEAETWDVPPARALPPTNADPATPDGAATAPATEDRELPDGWDIALEDAEACAGPQRSGRPAAEWLDAEQIAAILAEGDGDDPWAADSETLEQTPPCRIDPRIVRMTARLALTFGDRAGLDAVLTDGAATVILCATATDAEGARQTFKQGFTRRGPRHIKSREGEPQRVVVLSLTSASEADLAKAEEALAGPDALLVFADGTARLTGALARLPVVRLAPLCTKTMLWSLRWTHSATGRISERAVRAALPSGADLARMSPGLVDLALRADGPLRAARKLAEFAAPAAPEARGLTLDDLPGTGAAGAWMARLVTDVAAWRAGTLDWSGIEGGLLLAGPPGVGKTLLAETLARSLDATFLPTTLGRMQSHERGRRVIEEMIAIFAAARAAAAGGGVAVLFLDEIDSFGSRDRPQDHNTTYYTNVLNTLLTEVAGALACEGVIVIAASNYPEHLDPALVRAGRLGRRLDLHPPALRQIPDVLRHHLGDDLAQADLAPVARRAEGLTHADLAALVTAARARARGKRRALRLSDLQHAARRRRPLVDPDLRHRLAVYAAGRAVLTHATGSARVDRLQLSGGTTRIETTPVPNARTRADTGRALAALLGGRAAEETVLGRASGQAEDDLAQATRLALAEALSHGHTSLVWCDATGDPATLFARHPGLRDRVTARLEGALARARDLVCVHRETVEMIAADLLVDGGLEDDTLDDALDCCRPQGGPAEDDGGAEDGGAFPWMQG